MLPQLLLLVRCHVLPVASYLQICTELACGYANWKQVCIIRPLSMRIEVFDFLEQMSLSLPSFLPYHFEVAPWVHSEIVCAWTLTKHSKNNDQPTIIFQEFHELQEKYSDFVEFYTDGTNTLSYVGCAVISDTYTAVHRISPNAFLFTAELYGVLATVKHIQRHRILKLILFVDSQKCVDNHQLA